MLQIQEIDNLAELGKLRSVWSGLLAQTPGANFFQSLAWLSVYWRHYGTGQRLRVLAVYESGHCIGILPLVVKHQRRRLGALRVLTYPLDDWGSFYGPIGSDARRVLAACLRYLRTVPRDWDLLELPWVDARGHDAGATAAALDEARCGGLSQPWQSSALIDLSLHGDWPTYWASRTSRWRNNVRRSEKKLAERGAIRYVRYRPAAQAGAPVDPCWDWYDACERIAAASWQATSQTGTTITHERVRPFLRDCHAAAAQAGVLDLNLLLLDERPVAFNYAYHYRGYVFGLRTGYDASAACEGAGSVLQARMIEDCFARGDRLYDLGPGYLACKRYWQTEVRQSERYTYFPPTAPRAQLVRLKRSFERWWGKSPAAGKASPA